MTQIQFLMVANRSTGRVHGVPLKAETDSGVVPAMALCGLWPDAWSDKPHDGLSCENCLRELKKLRAAERAG